VTCYPQDVLAAVAATVDATVRRPALVVVDGQGGSGKSTFARELAGCVSDAVVVEGDDFYSSMDEQVREQLGPEDGYEQYFDWQRLRDQVMVPVRQASAALRYQRYDWEHGRTSQWVEQPMPAVVIVEGVYSLRPQLRDLSDVKVYVEATEEARLRRQRDRGENSEEWIGRWVAAEDFYVTRFAPQQAADFVVRGD